MVFLILLIFPVLIALGSYFFGNGNISIKELFIHIGVQIVIAGISILIIYHSNVTDIETWNGQVTNKKRVEVSCRHSYACNPYPCDCGKNGCSTCWQTCYEHSYDVDWNIYSNIGEWSIDTIDRQGLKEPPRWTIVNSGDSVSNIHSYDNYIKGSSNTLFRYAGLVDKFKDKLPGHPDDIYDYYKLDRVIIIGYPLADNNIWNKELSHLNSIVGYQKGCNIILVIANKYPREYFYALTQHWLGGKKNDITILINMNGNLIDWVEVMAWTNNEMFKIKLRDDILDVKKLDRNLILKTIFTDTIKYYQRKSMKDFEYLKASITPTPTQWIISMVVGFLCSIGLGIFFYKNEV